MQKLTWDEFVANVQAWATERGIYQHSSPMAQLLKTLSEIGELADGIIKKDNDLIMDALGDICVCLVNHETMMFRQIKYPEINFVDEPEESIGVMAETMGVMIQVGGPEWMANEILEECLRLSIEYDLDLLDCCSRAWHEIKDRKGRMVPGGAFVKDA